MIQKKKNDKIEDTIKKEKSLKCAQFIIHLDKQ